MNYYTKALNFNSMLVDAYEKKSIPYYFQEKDDEVIEDFQTYLGFAPAKAEAYRMLGMGYLKKGIYDPAIANSPRLLN